MANLVEEVLSDLEKEMLTNFANNDVMREAVKKVLLVPIYHNGVLEKGERTINPAYNWALTLAAMKSDFSDEQIGHDVRVTAEGIRVVENAFSQIMAYKTNETEPKAEPNPAI